MGTTQIANDGILFHSLRGVSLRDVKDGSSNTLIMGRARHLVRFVRLDLLRLRQLHRPERR